MRAPPLMPAHKKKNRLLSASRGMGSMQTKHHGVSLTVKRCRVSVCRCACDVDMHLHASLLGAHISARTCSIFDPLEDSAAQTGAEGQNSTLIDAFAASKLTDCAESGEVSAQSVLHVAWTHLSTGEIKLTAICMHRAQRRRMQVRCTVLVWHHTGVVQGNPLQECDHVAVHAEPLQPDPAALLEDVRAYCKGAQRSTVDFTQVMGAFVHADVASLDRWVPLTWSYLQIQ